MIEPEGKPAQVPSDPKTNNCGDEVLDTPVPDSHADTTKSENNTENTDNNERVRNKLAESWKAMRKVFYSSKRYVFDMFFEDKAAFWTMAFTAILTGFTYLLVVVTNKVDETTRAAQRAFVSSNGVYIGGTIPDPITGKITAYQLFVLWNNSGTTPTRKAIAWVNLKSDTNEPLPKDFAFPYDAKIQKVAVEMGAKVSVASVPVHIPVETVWKLQHQQIRLYIWGEATYYDIFDKHLRHVTDFCSELTNVSSTSLDLTNPQTHVNIENIACDRHNCNDETCKQQID
jgi:hypothetical protein